MKAGLFVLYCAVLGLALGPAAFADTADGSGTAAQVGDEKTDGNESDSDQDPECE